MTNKRGPIVDLAEVLETYTRSQRELLECVRQFRATIRTAVPLIEEESYRSDEPITSPASMPEAAAQPAYTDVPSRPPLPTPQPELPVEPPREDAPSKAPAAATAELVQAIRSASPTVASTPHHDYDYFAELDRKLAALETQLEQGLE